MATEIAIFPLQPNKSFFDAEGQPDAILKNTFDVLTKQPGFQRAFYGHEVEHPDVFRLFVTWDKVQSHIDFTKTEIYKPFFTEFCKIADEKKAVLYHAPIRPSDEQILNAQKTPATETLVVYFPSDFSQAEQQEFTERFDKLCGVVKSNWDGYTGHGGGWVEEELPIPNADDEKGKAFAGFIGWKSVQSHLDFRQTQEFKDNIHLLRGTPRLKTLTVVHFSGTEVVK